MSGKKPKKVNSGLTIDPDVNDLLNEQKAKQDRSRSWLLNDAIRRLYGNKKGQAKGE